MAPSFRFEIMDGDEFPYTTARRQLEHCSTSHQAVMSASCGCRTKQVSSLVHEKASTRKRAIGAVLKAVESGFLPSTVVLRGKLEDGPASTAAVGAPIWNKARRADVSSRFVERSRALSAYDHGGCNAPEGNYLLEPDPICSCQRWEDGSWLLEGRLLSLYACCTLKPSLSAIFTNYTLGCDSGK